MRGTTKIKIIRLTCFLLITIILSLFSIPVGMSGQIGTVLASDNKVVHTVKTGETLFSISMKYNVSIKRLKELNNISDENLIYPGERLIINPGKSSSKSKTSSRSESASNKDGSDIDTSDSSTLPTDDDMKDFSLNVNNADLRDVLSAIAVQMRVNVILVGDSTKVTFKVENVSAEQALYLLIQSIDMTCYRNDDLIVVGTEDKLKTNFFDQLIMTRFSLKYVSASNMCQLLQDLGIPLQKVTFEQNPKVFWAQGTPMALKKIKEMITALDRSENNNVMRVPVDKAEGEMAYNRLYARRALLSELTGISKSAMHISDNISGDDLTPYYVLWVEGMPEDIKRVREMVSKLDNP